MWQCSNNLLRTSFHRRFAVAILKFSHSSKVKSKVRFFDEFNNINELAIGGMVTYSYGNMPNKRFKRDSQRAAFLLCVGLCGYGVMRKLGSGVGCPLSGRYVTVEEKPTMH